MWFPSGSQLFARANLGWLWLTRTAACREVNRADSGCAKLYTGSVPCVYYAVIKALARPFYSVNGAILHCGRENERERGRPIIAAWTLPGQPITAGVFHLRDPIGPRNAPGIADADSASYCLPQVTCIQLFHPAGRVIHFKHESTVRAFSICVGLERKKSILFAGNWRKSQQPAEVKYEQRACLPIVIMW